MSYSPYQPPPYQPPPFQVDPRFAAGTQVPAQWPVVLIWYILYCVVMALLYLVCVGLGILLIAVSHEIQDKEMTATQWQIMGGVIIVVSLPLLLLFAAGPLLPRNKLGWIFGIIAIAIGMTSACTIIPCVLLLIGWLQRDTKLYYGMNA